MNDGRHTSRQKLGPHSPVLCALTAACHDNQVRELGRQLPEDEFAMADCEPDGERLVREEGWIYFPK